MAHPTFAFSVSGAHGIVHLLNNTFEALASFSVLTLLISYHYFDALQPLDRDD
jgi:hypothetical protein